MTAKFIGFSTNNNTEVRNYTLRDIELVKRNLLNELYTRRGERVMMPDFGSSLQDLVMETYSPDIEEQIEDEITNAINNEPRLELNTIDIRVQDHLIEIEVSVVYVPGSIADVLFLEFSRSSESVT
jgi:phage baseplate assembly protein W